MTLLWFKNGAAIWLSALLVLGPKSTLINLWEMLYAMVSTLFISLLGIMCVGSRK